MSHLDLSRQLATIPRPIFATEKQTMYAIIEESGKQFKVTSGDRIRVDRDFNEDEKSITFDKVLLIAGEGEPKIGVPFVGGATVTADVIGAVKGPKIDIFKYKRRKGYRRRKGHRQGYTAVKISAAPAAPVANTGGGL